MKLSDHSVQTYCFSLLELKIHTLYQTIVLLSTINKNIAKPLILIIAEGRNVTESQYFRHFQEQHADYNIKVLIPGHVTDPSGLQKAILHYWNQYGMDKEKGDVAFIVLDLDCDSEKGKLIRKLEKENGNARFVVSNPCFEVWFLLHYRYSTRPYYTSADVIKDLRKYVPDYEKNTDIAVLIANDIEIAMKNAEKLRHHFLDMGAEWPSAACNPCTDVPIIIDVINGYRNGGGAL